MRNKNGARLCRGRRFVFLDTFLVVLQPFQLLLDVEPFQLHFLDCLVIPCRVVEFLMNFLFKSFVLFLKRSYMRNSHRHISLVKVFSDILTRQV
jgi:hypothetical protein